VVVEHACSFDRCKRDRFAAPLVGSAFTDPRQPYSLIHAAAEVYPRRTVDDNRQCSACEEQGPAGVALGANRAALTKFFRAAGMLLAASLPLGCNSVLGYESAYVLGNDASIADTSAGGAAGDASAEADATSSCDGGAQSIGVLSEPCCTAAELACAGHAHKLVLICDPKSRTWAALQSCGGKQLCDATAGSSQGSCQEPIEICVGRKPGDKVCDGIKLVECGPDLVTSTETICTSACDDGECVGQCVPGTRQCNGATPELCDEGGAWQGEPPCAYLCTEQGQCSGVCTPGSKQCIGQIPQDCGADARWKDGLACAQVCSAGACVSACVNASTQCSGKVLQSCVNGAWQDNEVCPYLCSNGACSGSCSPGSKQCAGLVPQGCDSKGAWQDGSPCQYVCTAGTCSGECTPGTTECNGLTPRTCDPTGQWQGSTACAYICSNGACSGVCTPGDQTCKGQVPQGCNPSGQWEDGATCPYVCTAGTCAGACSPQAKQCNGLVPQVCNGQGGWDDGTACPWVCQNGACTGECIPGGTRCSAQVPQSCDANGAWQGSTSCPYACSAGLCVGECVPGSTQCSGNDLQTCDASGQWQAGTPCSGSTPVCSSGQCVAQSTGGPSCAGLPDTCGTGGVSCCASSLVPGGTYHRSYEQAYPATIGDFRLDRFEITVGRFRKFVAAWVGGWRPSAGTGKHTHLNGGSGLAATGGGYETGWDTSWSTGIATTASGWNYNLMNGATNATWTTTVGGHETLPINLATWFELYAFCIWDGGFLPSEAEWNYAAAGGNEQRRYPWANPPDSSTIDCTYANYDGCAGDIVNVGLGSPKGDGRWGQADLAGNTWDWTLDWYASYKNPCSDCAHLTAATYRVIRGGAYWTGVSVLDTSYRDGATPSHRNPDASARCARTP
jgi:formylglycine-generating enzyme required for sulfatase activity